MGMKTNHALEAQHQVDSMFLPPPELWEVAQALLPAYVPNPKGGRQGMPEEKAFKAIYYFLRSGIQWSIEFCDGPAQDSARPIRHASRFSPCCDCKRRAAAGGAVRIEYGLSDELSCSPVRCCPQNRWSNHLSHRCNILQFPAKARLTERLIFTIFRPALQTSLRSQFAHRAPVELKKYHEAGWSHFPPLTDCSALQVDMIFPSPSYYYFPLQFLASFSGIGRFALLPEFFMNPQWQVGAQALTAGW